MSIDKPRKGARRLEVDGEVWWWFCKVSVVIWNPEGVVHKTEIHTIKKTTPDTVERGQWKSTADGALFPREVRSYIKSELVWTPA